MNRVVSEVDVDDTGCSARTRFSTTAPTVGGEVVDFERVDPLVDELEELGRGASGEAVPETGAAEGIAALRVILDALGSG